MLICAGSNIELTIRYVKRLVALSFPPYYSNTVLGLQVICISAIPSVESCQNDKAFPLELRIGNRTPDMDIRCDWLINW